ncbi:MAG: hypothetical protein LBR42_04380 [Candidatus Methanoplasma sp.]|jgi:hypothetical protein|nr:hypothetical protein [Candidatus Methanoplasma sp.]
MAKKLTPEAVEEIKNKIYNMLDYPNNYDPYDFMMAIADIAHGSAIATYEGEQDRILELKQKEKSKKKNRS